MTPLALKLMRETFAKDPAARSYLARAVCFDVSAVEALILRTARELAATQHGGEQTEHGGLLFLPSEVTWIERTKGDVRAGLLLNGVEDEISYTLMMANGGEVSAETLTGFIQLDPDGEHFSLHLDARGTLPATPENERLAAEWGAWTAAAILLINAPRGVERITSHPHRGLERDLRKVGGIPALRPYHTIRLSTRSERVGDGPGQPGSPKAFHFCRSHVRKLPGGATTRVRAHWRGDPALGVARGDYEVRV